MNKYESLLHDLDRTGQSGFDKDPPRGISVQVLESLNDDQLLELYFRLRKDAETKARAAQPTPEPPGRAFVHFVTRAIQNGLADPGLQPICRELARIAEQPGADYTLERTALVSHSTEIALLLDEFAAQTEADTTALRAALQSASLAPVQARSKRPSPSWLAGWSPEPDRHRAVAGAAAKDRRVTRATTETPVVFEQAGVVFRLDARHAGERLRVVLTSDDASKVASVTAIALDGRTVPVERIAYDMVVRIDRIVFEDYKRRYLADAGTVERPRLTFAQAD
jgi:hypothetical protein